MTPIPIARKWQFPRATQRKSIKNPEKTAPKSHRYPVQIASRSIPEKRPIPANRREIGGFIAAVTRYSPIVCDSARVICDNRTQFMTGRQP
jgi:hypothetical protein